MARQQPGEPNKHEWWMTSEKKRIFGLNLGLEKETFHGILWTINIFCY